MIRILNGKPSGRTILSRKGDQSISSTNKKNMVGSYVVDVESLDQFVLEMNVEEKIKEGKCKCVYIIDEIGKMELKSQAFKALAFKLLNDENVFLIATIPVKDSLNIISQYQSNSVAFTVDFSNRNLIHENIFSVIKSNISSN